MDGSADPSHPRHVAIVRLTSLGDVIHTLPLAAAIRRHFPHTRITWLVEEREQILLRDNPCVDDVVIVPLRRWRRSLTRAASWRESWAELRVLSRTLRSDPIDVAIDVQGWSHKTSPLTLLTRARVRIGFDRAHARDPISPLATNHHVTPPPQARHIVDQNLCLLRPLGVAEPGPAEFPMPLFADAASRAAAWRHAAGILDTDRLVVLLPSTRGEAKRWPADAFREIARRALAHDAVRVAILGGPDEEALLSEVARGLPSDRVHVWAPAPIPDLIAVIRGSHLAIGNDTGPLHVAAASGVPALGLFGPTRGARNGPYGDHGAYLQSPTGRINDLSVDEVWTAVERLVRRTVRPT
jgi:lipopolysaccharide heptosyltransferase I